MSLKQRMAKRKKILAPILAIALIGAGVGIGAVIFSNSSSMTFTISAGEIWFELNTGQTPSGMTASLSDLNPLDSNQGKILTIDAVAYRGNTYQYKPSIASNWIKIVNSYGSDTITLTFSANPASGANDLSRIEFIDIADLQQGAIQWDNSAVNYVGIAAPSWPDYDLTAGEELYVNFINVMPTDSAPIGSSLGLDFDITYIQPGT